MASLESVDGTPSEMIENPAMGSLVEASAQDITAQEMSTQEIPTQEVPTQEAANMDTTVPEAAALAPAEPEEEPTELDKYWKAVKENPTDFTGWTYLLQYVEQEIDVDKAREAFDAFLQRYPYCYGYWKKYADLERKYNNFDKAVEVFDRGLEGIPLSIDLWIHYINFASGQLESETETEAAKEEKIRRLYERAITASGTDFKSDKLWEMYIFWEKEKKNMQHVTALYDRLFTIPTQLYAHHFEQFQEHVKASHPKDILSLDEFLRLRQKVLASKTPTETPVVSADDGLPPGMEPAGDAPPGEEAPPGMEGVAETTSAVDDEEATGVREKIIELREAVHRLNEQEVSKRWSYEEGIRRPYFHVKPLERGQLKIWKEYLDYEIENGTHERVVVLFERCLIACALYEEFWLKYAKYMEPHSIEGVRHIYTRGCRTHLPKKPNLHMAWAAFEEKQGNHSEAAEVLESLEQNVPGLVMVALRRISLQRRMGQFEAVDSMYKSYLENATKEDVRSFYAIKYARYQSKVIGNKDVAKQALESALEKDTTNVKLYLQLIDLEYSKPTVDETALNTLFEKAITSPLAIEHRIAFSQRRLEFLEDFCADVGRILDGYTGHQDLLKETQTSGQKRKPEDEVAGDAKKAKVAPATTPAAPAATPATPATTTTNGAGDTSQTAAYSQADYSQYNQYNNYQQGWGGYGSYGYPQQGWGAYGSQYYGSQ